MSHRKSKKDHLTRNLWFRTKEYLFALSLELKTLKTIQKIVKAPFSLKHDVAFFTCGHPGRRWDVTSAMNVASSHQVTRLFHNVVVTKIRMIVHTHSMELPDWSTPTEKETERNGN